ncbi:MAG: phosphoribosyltransferase family protein [Chloroflexi bacterium]|nr:phosphoribosyltransferase family protein [Chloroflexota bacterium]
MPLRRYRDRADAGRQLAAELKTAAGPDTLVLGAPRGGVAVAAAVAEELGAPLDVLAAHKLGAPGQPELAVGAIAEGGAPLVNTRTAALLGISDAYLRAEAERQYIELERRVGEYREGRALPSLEGRRVLLVDDGLATGLTILAAAGAVLNAKPADLLVAAPVGSPEAMRLLQAHGLRVVCPYVPERLWAVGAAYDAFPQVSDTEVKELLAAARRRMNRQAA